ncbi:unnamed protein product [Peronospora farinosa]|uniref:Uncharacterized protein n=1 Tax=Peronospora farinosa TaxID=134698 RepID=A0AAV0UPQ1_9STRA|nr:unnamed protein product [Peronospora farinosa]
MHDNRQAKDTHKATVEAFYVRVIHRVCSLYQNESESPSDEAIARLQQKWQETLRLYTGKQEPFHALADEDDVLVIESSTESEHVSDESSSTSSSSSSSSSDSETTSEQAVGRPSVQMPSAATSSIFAKMLGGKRKLHQLDGSASDAEDGVKLQESADLEWRQELQRQSTGAAGNSPTALRDSFDEQEDNLGDEVEDKEDIEEKEAHRMTCEKEGNEVDALELDEQLSPSRAHSDISTSLLVSSDDLAPVSGLSGINLPLQLAAECSKFTYRGKRRGYTGQLHAIVLTWPNRLGVRETICPGELVWCYPNSAPRFIDEGELVKAISAGDTGHELKVELSNGKEAMVSMDRIRRLCEYLVRRGSVRFNTEQ